MPNEFKVKNGLVVDQGGANITGSSSISGSLVVTSGITGSLQGTASFALNAATSSFVLNAVSASFATTASFVANAFVLPSLTNGSVLFSNGTTIAQDNANFFWDDTNNRLGIGTATPANTLDVNGSAKVTSLIVNTSGQSRTITTFQGAGSDGNNIFIGGGGLSSGTGGGASSLGSYNTSIGVSALRDNTTGFANIALGYFSLLNNTSGNNNMAIGYRALLNNSTGNFNVAVGLDTLISNTSGNQNTAIGVQALLNNITATDNTAIGVNALFSNTTGNNNIAIGTAALRNNSTGLSNTALGYQAGFGTGTNSNTSGSNNIFIGNESVGVSATESNRTWIGNGSTTSTWLGGSLLLGTTTSVASAILNISSTTKGILIPRMTTSEKNAIGSPATGLQVYDTTTNSLEFYNGTAWQSVSSGGSSITIADEGTSQGTATFLNFTGAGVTATVTSNTASINIPGGGGSAFPFTGSAVITGSLIVTGSVRVTAGITGSLLGTASFAVSAQSSVSSSYPIIVEGTSLKSVKPLGGTNGSINNSIFFGDRAGEDTANANNSNFLGQSAGQDATNASNSNFLGFEAGASATYANYSNFLGYQAGSGSIGIAESIYQYHSNFFGTQAGYGATNAANSIFIGQRAGNGDTVDNTLSELSSILIGSYTNTGGYSNSILLGSGIIGSPIANTKANQFMLADTITDVRWSGIEYTLPSTQAANPGDVLSNDSMGTLSWITPSVPSPFPFTGSAVITGSLIVTGSLRVTTGITGSLFGTSSWANNATTASYVLNAVSASFATTASFLLGNTYTVTSVSTTYSETATSGTRIIKGNTTGGAFSITLPTAVGNTATIIIKKTAGTPSLTVDGAGTETIDDGLTAVINRVYESITLVSDNANWLIV